MNVDMKYDVRAMTEAERMYSYEQSDQLSMMTGLIGYLRADMGSDGKGFFPTWSEYRDSLSTQTFRDEFDTLINELRASDSFLCDRSSLSKFCYSYPDCAFDDAMSTFGVRVDTDKYAYLMRLEPNSGAYDLYCYCYQKAWLDRHISNAEKGIRFIDPNYKEQFRISDGEKIRITRSDGSTDDRVCRYIDDYHFETCGVWTNIFHICEFAELTERNGNTVIPMRSSLPEQCYVYLPTTGDIGIVKKGESGYYKSDLSPVYGDEGKDFVDELNEQGGITKAQSAAMSAGSMFGWGCDAADPKNYDSDGNLKKPDKNKDISR